MEEINLNEEFDRQVQNLLDRNYPQEIGVKEEEFKKLTAPLKENLSEIRNRALDVENGVVPFVIVVKRNLVFPEKAMGLTNWNGKNGITKLFPLNPRDFKTIELVKIPEKDIYLLIEINRGAEYLNIPPQDALVDIDHKKLTPLTIDEGIALITHFPKFLKRNNCFSLLACRKGNDKRVPAIWINSKNEANLGWCWNGNPHTWLGSAFAAKRF